MTYDKTTRTLHRFLAAGVVLQILLSLVMSHPKPGYTGNWLFTLHSWAGLAVGALLVVHWVKSLPKYRATPHYLFPWTTRAGIDAVIADARLYIQAAKERKIPESDVPTPLPGAIQGIGLIVASALAFTGFIIYFSLYPNGQIGAFGWLAKQIHELLASVLWTFLIVHVGAAVLHQIYGQPLITQMFRHKED